MRRPIPTLGLTVSAVLLLLTALPVAALEVDHDLRVALFPSRARLEGVDRIRVRPQGARQLAIALSGALDDLAVEVDGRAVDVEPSGDALELALPAVPPEGTVTVSVRYAGVFDDPAPTLPANTDNPGYGVTGTIGERGAFLLSGAGWYPRITADRVSFRVRIEAPAGLIAVTAGRSTGVRTEGRTTVSTWEADHAVEGLSLSAGRYRVRETRAGGVTVATYFTERSRDLEEAYLEASARHIERFQALFGPYPFETFAVVENFFPTGYGFPSYTLLGTRVLRLPFILETSLAHEIAHCWWGNGVLVDPEGGNWSEGLTSYVADYLSRERASTEAAREHRRQWLRNYASLVRPSDAFPLSRFQGRYDPVTKAIGYDKAAMVFHMLRREVGDAAFREGLQDLFRDYRFQRASWDDLQRVFEAGSGRDLAPFFRQWVRRAGAPVVVLRDVQRRATETGWETTGLIEQEEPSYAFRAPLRLDTAGGSQLHSVEVSGRVTPFRMESPGEPRGLRFDPDWDLFRRLHPSELPPTINDLRGADEVGIRLAEDAGPGLKRAARTLAAGLGLANPRWVSNEAAGTQAMKAQDWILVGTPGPSPLLDGLPDTVRVSNGRVLVNGEALDHPEEAFFGVFRNPRRPGRVVALFWPNPRASVETVARKVPHYGRYSYLVFHGEENRQKEVWPVTSSPLTVDWTGKEETP